MTILRLFILSLLLIILGGCAENNSTANNPLPPTWAVEDIFVPYVQEFIDEGYSRGVETSHNLVVVMRDSFSYTTSPNTVGLCSYPNKERAYPLVEIKRSYWEAVDTDSKRELLFHELGHCLLLRGHTSDSAYVPSLSKSVPLSIMNPYVLTDYGLGIFDFYLDNFSSYLDELFDPTKIASLRTIANNSLTSAEENLRVVSSTDTEPVDIGGQDEFTTDGECVHSNYSNPGEE